jgi:hypothetical protein
MGRARLPLLAVAVVIALFLHGRAGGSVTTASGHPGPDVSDQSRAATLSFAPEVTPADRTWILAAVAQARPEAARLIGEVDGLVTIQTEAGSAQVMGWTQRHDDRYRISLNIALLDGERAIDRPNTVLHELGHVVDDALVPRDLATRLDAGIPRPATCGDTGGPFGACAPQAERFADTFAKWALGGAVSQVGAGYGIPAPPSLEDWGRPLGALAAGLPA